MYELKQINNFKEWRPEEIFPDAHIMQSYYYSSWQKEFGNQTYNLAFYKSGKPIAMGVFMLCPLFGKIKYVTSPYGPVVSSEFSLQDAKEFNKELKKFFKDKNVAFVRLDFEPPKLAFSYPGIKAKWFTQQGACFQPRREWVLDLSLSEEELLSGMHQKTRYNVRLAKKKGVKVQIIKDDLEKYFDEFYSLLSYTAQKNNFHIHPKSYYKLAFKYAQQNNGYLAIARLDNEKEPLTANLILVYGRWALFAYGGSSSKHRNLMPNYLAQWEAAKHAKEMGLKYYSFGGYFDEDGPKLKPSTLEARSRFSVFKRKFGGFCYEHGDFYDLPLNWPVYALWNLYKLAKHP